VTESKENRENVATGMKGGEPTPFSMLQKEGQVFLGVMNHEIPKRARSRKRAFGRCLFQQRPPQKLRGGRQEEVSEKAQADQGGVRERVKGDVKQEEGET